MSIVELNGNLCNEIVIDQDSMDEMFTSESEPATYKYDPEGTEIEVDADLEIEADVQEAIAELEGDESAVAQCRAAYDVNELEGGFCCQSIGLEFSELMDSDPEYMGFMTSATKVVKQAEDPVVVNVGFEGADISVTWGAEVFASGRALAASVVTVAATAMLFDF